MSQQKTKTGAMNALSNILAVRKGTKVIVIADKETLNVANAFINGAESLGANTILYLLPPGRPLKEVPVGLLELIEQQQKDNSDLVFLNTFSGIGEETPLRLLLLKRESDSGARVGHAPGIDDRMMTEGPMNVDYKALAIEARLSMKRFENAKQVRITSPSGTDIVLNIENRAFETDVEVPKGSMGNLPAGEIWCAPVEDSADGLIFADGSVGDLGRVEKPIKLTVSGGKLTELSGGTREFMKKLMPLLDVDEEARIVGELGIGLNPSARITGNLLEDEKAGGTAHIAFGFNLDMPGGKNKSKTHRDFLFLLPTMEVTITNGKKSTVMKDGKFTLGP